MTEESKNVPASDFIRENERRVYDFAFYLLGGDQDELGDFVLETFREFGSRYRKLWGSPSNAWGRMEMKILLFSIAWDRLQRLVRYTPVRWVAGRDTRLDKSMEEDLLSGAKEVQSDKLRDSFIRRFSRVDIDFRAPVVLRDVLQFPDEEVAKILKLRWGVYRHRLHRGRLELCEGLKGKPYAFPAPEARS